MNYAAIYTTRLLRGRTLNAFHGDVAVEVFGGPRQYSIMTPMPRTVVPGVAGDLGGQLVDLQLPEGAWFVALIARAKDADQDRCEDLVDGVMLMLAAEFGDGLFDTQVYRGWLANRQATAQQFWVKTLEPLHFDDAEFVEYLSQRRIDQSLAPDMSERVTIMSRFYVRALLLPPTAEWLLAMWIVLEVYPMMGSKSVRKLADFLAGVLSMESTELRTKLALGQLYGVRGELVHHGRYRPDAVPDCTARLEAIVSTVLRAIHGRSYNGALDKFV